MRTSFAIVLGTCEHCGGRTKVIALVRDRVPDCLLQCLVIGAVG
jgi:hypothetical protein